LIAQNASSSREIPLEKFFVDAFETCLEQDEVMTGIRIPLPAVRSGTRYLKFGHLERPSVGVALHLALNGDGGSIAVARFAVGCVGPKPCRVEEAEELLRGKSLKAAVSVLGQAGGLAARAGQAITDIHGSAEYKEHIVKVLLTRAFNGISQELTKRKG
jgi:carbon-monoxide dehydrogenase medium subunit